jgi:hypothetical protein
MRTISTDLNNDIYRGADGNIAMVYDAEAVSETTKHFAATLRTEMIHEYDLGIPFFMAAFGAQPSIPQFEAATKQRIRQAPEVTGILSFQTIQTADVLSYTAVIETTTFGVVTING